MRLSLAVGMMAIGLSFSGTEARTTNGDIGISVRKPSPVLCPSETKFGTNCSGQGNGCEPVSCDDIPVIEPK